MKNSEGRTSRATRSWRRLRPLACALSVLACAAPLRAGDRILRAEVSVAATPAEAWKAWTTEEGVVSFFAPGCHIEPRVDGAYEIFFNPAGEPGQRGAEGMRILAFEPEQRLAFSWNAPPSIPVIRAQRTMVVLEFRPQDGGGTRVRFTHLGWGDGPEWDAAYAYFDKAWNGFVLPHFVHRFAKGPIDWRNPPQLPPLAASLRLTLVPVAAGQ